MIQPSEHAVRLSACTDRGWPPARSAECGVLSGPLLQHAPRVRKRFRDDARCRGRACSTLPVVGSNFCTLAKWVERARPLTVVLIPKTFKHPLPPSVRPVAIHNTLCRLWPPPGCSGAVLEVTS